MASEKRAVRKKARKRKRYLKSRPRTTLVTGKGDNVRSAKKAHRKTMKNARIKKKAIRRSKVKDARATKRASVKKARRSTLVPQKRRQAVRKARRTKRKSVRAARKG